MVIFTAGAEDAKISANAAALMIPAKAGEWAVRDGIKTGYSW